MGLTRQEQETIINFNEEEDTAYVYTASSLVATRLIKKGMKPVRTETQKDEKEISGWYFEIPKWAVRVKPGKAAINIGGIKPSSTRTEDPELREEYRRRFLKKK